MATSRIVKALRANTGARDLRTVFEDFCAMSGAAIRNRVDRNGYQVREDEYERTRSHYTAAQMDRFAEALAFVALELDAQPRDVLGETYMQLGIANRAQGQFFTPYSVAQLIASMQINDAPAQLLTRPFLTVYEPACGAGAMVIAMTQALAAQGIEYQTKVHVTADDISAIAVHMAYVQLSLLGVPAAVRRILPQSRPTSDCGRQSSALQRAEHR
ncbi:N-6 DNA methylase [Microbacterium flavum]|uniref:N-6 DNA methylase n=1 Tax=Microbacterium flavum TaxID=415216 RepID=UPI0024ADE916|nr:N-6 DNA methylase [Microbacterium flavum]